jgi:hypothetical protein
MGRLFLARRIRGLYLHYRVTWRSVDQSDFCSGGSVFCPVTGVVPSLPMGPLVLMSILLMSIISLYLFKSVVVKDMVAPS